MNLTTLAKLPGASRLSTLLFSVEEAWFDASRGVHTSQEVDLRGLNLVGQRKDSFKYRPIRPSIARKILRDLPITDPVQYTFIDVGSGKGRMLFLAAEYRFREIQGIEFAAELHDSAEANIRSYHSSKQRCSRIRSLLLNASDYSFPDDNLVIYFFNPFGHQVMSDVVQNLENITWRAAARYARNNGVPGFCVSTRQLQKLPPPESQKTISNLSHADATPRLEPALAIRMDDNMVVLIVRMWRNWQTRWI